MHNVPFLRNSHWYNLPYMEYFNMASKSYLIVNSQQKSFLKVIHVMLTYKWVTKWWKLIKQQWEDLHLTWTGISQLHNDHS